MKKDVTIHFTTKGQEVGEIKEKLENYLKEYPDKLPFNFSDEQEQLSVLHHCFLPEKVVIEKGFSNDIYGEILHPITDRKICWFGVTDKGLEGDRFYMLENLQKLDGIAIFIGEIKDGVRDEYTIVNNLGIEHIIIP